MFTTYKASAGAGKTTQLVAEYLSLCFSDRNKFRNILAITFTNNATAEMKERIVRTLYTFSFRQYDSFNGSEKKIFETIANYNQVKDKTLFQEKAKELLKEIIYDYPNLSVSTIDSFFQRIIRSFAFELGINLNYNIEIQLEDCYAQTIDLLINKISKEENDLTKRIMMLVEEQLQKNGKWNIEKTLQQALNVIYTEDAHEPVKALEMMTDEERMTAAKALAAKKTATKKKIMEKAAQGEAVINESGIDTSQFKSGKTGIATWFTRLKKNIFLEQGNNITKCIESNCFTKTEEMLSTEKNNALIFLLAEIKNLQYDYKKIDLSNGNIHYLLLLFDLKKIMDEIKRRDNLFYLSESNSMIADNIQGEETPYLYEKIGNKYGYCFIDEFQDTSNMQWNNMIPLVRNMIAEENHYKEEGKVFLFGDVKQAIYRFRNGDSRLFNELTTVEGYQKQINNYGINDKDFVNITLDTNYRTSHPVVEFNNLFFSYLRDITKNNALEDALTQSYYKDVVQQCGSSRSGFVHIRFKEKEDADAKQYMLDNTLSAVKDALERGYRKKDIAILCKGNDYGDMIAQFLSNGKEKYPVISSEALLLSSSDEVNLTLNILRYLTNSADRMVQLTIISTLIRLQQCNKTIEEMTNMMAKGDDFLQLLQTYCNIALNPSKLAGLPLFTLCKEIIKICRIDKVNAYIVAFLDTVYDYVSVKGNNSDKFINWWESHADSLSITSSKEIDAIKISTIHKSKGLEYPVVIIPLLEYGSVNTKKKLWYKDTEQDSGFPYLLINTAKQDESSNPIEAMNMEETAMTFIDNINLLYVAHTRPKDCLYIITGEQSAKNYSQYLYNFIRNNLSKYIDNELFTDFWYGDRDFKPDIKEEKSTTISCEQLYTSPFTLDTDQLVFGTSRAVTPEQQRGLVVHDFLSQLTFFPESEEEADEMLSDFELPDREWVKEAIDKIMQNHDLEPYFKKGVKVLNETSILSNDGTIWRPDRIVFTGKEVMILDYKTGHPDESHRQQLDNYCRLIERMGYSEVHSKIIYL